LTTAASLKNKTAKDLAAQAKKKGVDGWHSMRKDQLVRALLKVAKSKAAKSAAAKLKSAKAKPAKAKPTKVKKSAAHASRNGAASRNGKTHHVAASRNGAVVKNGAASRNGMHKSTTLRDVASAKTSASRSTGSAKATLQNGHASTPKTVAKKAEPSRKPTDARVVRKIQKAHSTRQHLKDLAGNGKAGSRQTIKDRAVLMVRDAYWLHAYWEVTRLSVQRAQAAMAEHWHTAKPTLRLMEVADGSTTSTVERVARDIEIHGGVNNWYIDIQDSPKSYRVAVGYLSQNGKFYALVRSNAVTTPNPGSSDAIDENWTDVAQNYEKIYALSGGYSDDGAAGDLQDLFEERLRRPMGSPVVTRYGIGAEAMLRRERDFLFEVDAEMIIYGRTKPNAHVALSGEPVKLRPDGTFTVRLSMPDRRQVIPVVASSGDGVEQRTTVLAIERNTKTMEPRIRDSSD
jgi:acylphosphatase